MCNGIVANLEQVKRGMAWRYVKYSRDPMIADAEKDAREQGRGLWDDKDPVAPWMWRHRQKTGVSHVR
jgi:micrococcal nuclease